jgi:hypothetical protein
MDLNVERTIDKPYRFVETALLHGPTAWLPGPRHRDGELTTELAVRVGGSRIGRAVVVQSGPAMTLPGRCQVSISWRAARHPELYPTLSGVLEATPVATRQTRLALWASYDPPAGAVGELADRAVMHRLAEASAEELMDRLTGVLGREALTEALGAYVQGRD